MTYLMDTHVWIWWHISPEKLSANVRDIIAAVEGNDQLLLSAISVWELAKLVEKNRLRLSVGINVWVGQAFEMPQFRLLDLLPEIAIESTRLPQPFHDDPADQIIVASSRIYEATILTADRLILAYAHARSLW